MAETAIITMKRWRRCGEGPMEDDGRNNDDDDDGHLSLSLILLSY